MQAYHFPQQHGTILMIFHLIIIQKVTEALRCNDTVPITMWRGGGVRSAECRLVLISSEMEKMI